MKLDRDELPHLVVTICLEVHKQLGLGLPASAYRAAVAHELRQREVIFERDLPFVFTYKDQKIETGEQIDFVIEDMIVLTVVAQESTGGQDKEQVIARLRMTGREIGFLVNFQNPDIRNGIKRLIVGRSAPGIPYQQQPGLEGLGRTSPVGPSRLPPPRKSGSHGTIPGSSDEFPVPKTDSAKDEAKESGLPPTRDGDPDKKSDKGGSSKTDESDGSDSKEG